VRPAPEDPFDQDFSGEQAAEERREARRLAIRWTAAFAILFAAVFFALWWSGRAVRFGADRVSETVRPTWAVRGTVVDATTGQPVPWAVVEDHPAGHPPYYRTEADEHGNFTLLTLADRHAMRVSAPGYIPVTVTIGRPWFLWIPYGEESEKIVLTRDGTSSTLDLERSCAPTRRTILAVFWIRRYCLTGTFLIFSHAERIAG
jgi:hypothetical protein